MLKQRKPLTRKTPMKRSAISRTHAAPKIVANEKPKPRRKSKSKPGCDQAARDACRGEPCYLSIVGMCLGSAGADTVVPAHSNQGIHGKGRGLKAHDRYTVPGCHVCHAAIDSGKDLSYVAKVRIWDAAYQAWEPVRALKLASEGRALAPLPISRVVPRAFKTDQILFTEAAA